MRRVGAKLFSALALAATLAAGLPARAGPFDLDDDDKAAPDKKEPATDTGFGTYTPPPLATIKGHEYTLAECLALTDRNHPNLWAARARLAAVHAQLEEAKWVPFSQWYTQVGFTVVPQVPGTVVYSSASQLARNPSFADGLNPFLTFNISGFVPFYTFGKITSAREAAEAQVRVSEWDLEKFRQQARMDVRRAYFGLMFARDAKYLVSEVLSQVDKAIDGLQKKLAADDKSVSEIDKFRFQVVRGEIVARAGEADRGETFALAALRFLTGVQTLFEIPDEPLKLPEVPLAPVVQYLTAARLFRPEVNVARALRQARKDQVDLARARLFPDLGAQFSFDYARAPAATPQSNAWAFDPLNHEYYTIGLALRWNLDLLPGAARVAAAESQFEESRALDRLALGSLAVEVENAYASVVEARHREEAWSGAEHKAKQWIATVQDQIDLGTAEEPALTEPLRYYINARVQHIVALMDCNVTQSQLALASGWDAAAPRAP
jgi:multidrug efflux system outer membrane protein